LTIQVVKTVVDKFLTELQAQLDEKRVTIEVDEEARDWLAREGYDEKMGARPMQRLIQEKIKRQLAEDLLFGELAQGGVVTVGVEDGELSVKVLSAAEV
jgi:ATP-dependent Clp protease ATP-binding subunit ClpA